MYIWNTIVKENCFANDHEVLKMYITHFNSLLLLLLLLIMF